MPIIPTGEGRGELEVKKSRFLALIYPLSRLNLHPKEMVKELKSMYKDQRHVVHAYRSLGAHEEGPVMMVSLPVQVDLLFWIFFAGRILKIQRYS
jgi:putative IMPACT (imprinted ancient) family translation regulator